MGGWLAHVAQKLGNMVESLLFGRPPGSAGPRGAKTSPPSSPVAPDRPAAGGSARRDPGKTIAPVKK
jgi:hypothetical protein